MRKPDTRSADPRTPAPLPKRRPGALIRRPRITDNGGWHPPTPAQLTAIATALHGL
jgi:hypothetical protein